METLTPPENPDTSIPTQNTPNKNGAKVIKKIAKTAKYNR
jgi:hypothetical protein